MKKFLFIVISVFLFSALVNAQNLKTFQLGNGMTVYIWEDHSSPSVYGSVAVRAGSIDDPAEYTGLAHYLEHMMFKGTEKIGTLDWAKEKPIYEQIIAEYDRMAEEKDSDKKTAISKKINELSIEESRLNVLNEYANLIEGIGGSGLNAGTSYDHTVYFNNFPSNEIAKWLPLAAERFVNPVFRAFQSELETVYEEYNLYEDNASSKQQTFLLSSIFEGSPYARPVIGLGEHLKNPRLSKLVKFYNDWYVPQNMALILVGDVDASKIVRLVNATFGRIAPRPMPQRNEMLDVTFKGRKQFTFKSAQYPSVFLCYKGVKRGAEDELALQLCQNLLSNDSGTGILDKKVISGDFMGAFSTDFSFAHQGRIIIGGIPYYDEAQRSYDSNRKVERMLNDAVAELSQGKFDASVLETIKINLCRDYDLQMESQDAKADVLTDVFISNLDLQKELNYKDRIMAVSVEDIKKAASSYFGKDLVVIYNEQGRVDGGQKIQKPDYKPLDPSKGGSSAYASWFRGMTSPALAENFVDWSKVQERQINSYSRLYYTPNEKNDVFTLILKYGANSRDLPKLKYGASLMNTAGIMASFDSKQIKEEFSKLGATYNVSADNNYMTVTLRGYEQNLEQACILLTRLLLMPKLDDKQLGNVIGGSVSERMIRRSDVNSLSEAMKEYLIYGDESRYIKELTDKEIVGLNIADLTGSVLEATKFAAEIHYSGQMPFDDVYSILSRSLPLQEGEKPTVSPVIRDMKEYKENTVVFVPNSSFQQTQIYFFLPMENYTKETEVLRQAFNRYFGGSFNGLVMQEIREYNSMAYTAAGTILTSGYDGKNQGLVGYIGTQNDKAMDAISLFLSLLEDLPKHPERFESIRSYLLQDALVKQPSDRYLSSSVAEWRRCGYTQDPAVTRLPQIKALTFDDIVSYYEKYIKGRPIAIGVVGSPKAMNAKQLSKFGKVVQMGEKDLFNKKDVLF